MSRKVLLVIGALWAAFGAACLAAPTGMLALTGIDLASAQGTTEIRAMYGGAQLGFGGFLVFASRQPGLVRPALIALALVMAGFALGRLCGIAVDGASDATTLVSLATEIAIFALASVALRREAAPLAAGAG